MVALSTTNLGPRLVHTHENDENVAQACSIVLSAHQVILPPGSDRSDPQAPSGEGLTPHTIHHYSFGPLQAITVVDQSDPDSGTVILTIPGSLLY